MSKSKFFYHLHHNSTYISKYTFISAIGTLYFSIILWWNIPYYFIFFILRFNQICETCLTQNFIAFRTFLRRIIAEIWWKIETYCACNQIQLNLYSIIRTFIFFNKVDLLSSNFILFLSFFLIFLFFIIFNFRIWNIAGLTLSFIIIINFLIQN